MRPTVEEWLDGDKLVLIQGWARDGLTDEQIAHNMGISVRTLYNWKKVDVRGKDGLRTFPIMQALKSGKEVVDYAVENALLKKAMAGDVTAQIFWLKNRRPDKWRDRPKEAGDTYNDDGLVNALFNSEEDWSDDIR